MCGIFGLYNVDRPYTRREIIDLLLKGLSRLEYRGYNSAGIAVDSGVNDARGEPLIFKEKGNIATLTQYTRDTERRCVPCGRTC